jgi:hypothetical protein
MSIGTELNNPRWLTQPRPLDGKTYFDDLEQAEETLTGPLGRKGLKFMVRDC